jgi:hypothetical protein
MLFQLVFRINRVSWLEGLQLLGLWVYPTHEGAHWKCLKGEKDFSQKAVFDEFTHLYKLLVTEIKS